MFLDDKHYEQDVYDAEGRPDPPASPSALPSASGPSRVVPPAESGTSRQPSWGTLALLLALGVGAVVALSLRGPAIILSMQFLLVVFALVGILVLVICLRAWSDRWNADRRRRCLRHSQIYVPTVEEARTARRWSFVWATIEVLGGIASLFMGSKKSD